MDRLAKINISNNLGAIPWLLTSELFDSESRAKANSVSTFTNWSCAFIVTVSFPFLEVNKYKIENLNVVILMKNIIYGSNYKIL